MKCLTAKSALTWPLIEYGYNIPEVTGAVQDRVKNAIETMTGLSVEDVNIRVAGVNLEDE